VEKYGTARQATDRNIIRCMLFACRVTKAADTHSECVIFITLFTATVVTRTHLSVTLIRKLPLVPVYRRRVVLIHGDRFTSTLNAGSVRKGAMFQY
jgi:hypothetical protein